MARAERRLVSAGLWVSNTKEESYWIQDVEGTIPPSLEVGRRLRGCMCQCPTGGTDMLWRLLRRLAAAGGTELCCNSISLNSQIHSQGTWYRNGPGCFEMGGEPMHVFDGHGLVGRVAFSGGRAHFASRFVRTPVRMNDDVDCIAYTALVTL